jgi:hypothetical protein
MSESKKVIAESQADSDACPGLETVVEVALVAALMSVIGYYANRP